MIALGEGPPGGLGLEIAALRSYIKSVNLDYFGWLSLFPDRAPSFSLLHYRNLIVALEQRAGCLT